MNQVELLQAVTSAGLSARIKGNEVQIETCIFCSNPKHNLELNAGIAAYHCWSCGAGGSLSYILKQITGKHFRIERDPNASKKRERTAREAPTGFKTQPVDEVESAMYYLTNKRGITREIAREYGIVVCTDPNHMLAQRILIPAYEFWSERQAGWHARSYTNQKPKYLSTLEEKIVTGWRSRGRGIVVVVEGSFDGIAAHRAGFDAAVLGGTSGPHLSDWAGRLRDEKVAIALDGDALDQAERLYWSLFPILGGRLHKVMLPPESDPASVPTAWLQEVVSSAVGENYTAGNERRL